MTTIKVRQVRDSIDVDRIMGISAFAIVTKIVRHKDATMVTYDMVTDTEVVRNITTGALTFADLFPVVYLDDVRTTAHFGKGYGAC